MVHTPRLVQNPSGTDAESRSIDGKACHVYACICLCKLVQACDVMIDVGQHRLVEYSMRAAVLTLQGCSGLPKDTC